MNAAERLIIERTCAAAALEDEETVRCAFAALGARPFRSRDADELNRILNFCGNLILAGMFDARRNDLLLLEAMVQTQWPAGWSDEERVGFVELLWTPLACAPELLNAPIDCLRDENEAFDQLLAVRERFATDRSVTYALEQEHLWAERPRPRISDETTYHVPTFAPIRMEA